MTKENINEFLSYYHYFHDSRINKIDYNIDEDKIDIYINACFAGQIFLEDGVYNKSWRKIKIQLKKIIKCNIQEFYTYDDINELFLKFIKKNNQDFVCFATEEENPSIYIVCESIEYEELN